MTPMLQRGDWIRGPFSSAPVEVTNPDEWSSPDTLARLTEIRKRDGGRWSRSSGGTWQYFRGAVVTFGDGDF